MTSVKWIAKRSQRTSFSVSTSLMEGSCDDIWSLKKLKLKLNTNLFSSSAFPRPGADGSFDHRSPIISIDSVHRALRDWAVSHPPLWRAAPPYNSIINSEMCSAGSVHHSRSSTDMGNRLERCESTRKNWESTLCYWFMHRRHSFHSFIHPASVNALLSWPQGELFTENDHTGLSDITSSTRLFTHTGWIRFFSPSTVMFLIGKS